LYPIKAGDTSLIQTWKDYVQALNDRNQEKLAEMIANDVKLYYSNGTEINGIKALTKINLIYLQQQTQNGKQLG